MKKINLVIIGTIVSIMQLHAQTETLKVWIEDAIITADGNSITKLVISENDEVDYTAFSLSLVVPNGVTVAKIKQGREYVNDIQLSERATSTHSISCNMLEDGRTIKIISTSSNNYDFYPDDVDGNPLDEIFTIGLVADPSIANGDYSVKIVDCKFVMKENADASIPQNEITAKLTIEGGIDSESIIYTLDDNRCGTLILPFNSQIPEGLEIFRVLTIDNGNILLEKQSQIPENIPVIVMGTSGTYVFNGVSTQTEDSYNDGDYIGVYSNRKISNGYILQSIDGVIGFYPISNESQVLIPTYRCYLQCEDKFDVIPIDSSALIGNVLIDKEQDGNSYDLLGRKMILNKNDRSIYVRKGKKILNK